LAGEARTPLFERIAVKVVRSISRGGFGEVDEVRVKGKRHARKTFKPEFSMAVPHREREPHRISNYGSRFL
jgi:hypothetical protein